MEQKKIDRINELARKAKTTQGLTPEETAERAALRQEYLNSVMGNLRRELDNTWIVDEHGNKRKLTPGKKTMSYHRMDREESKQRNPTAPLFAFSLCHIGLALSTTMARALARRRSWIRRSLGRFCFSCSGVIP